ncbi:ribosomal protein S5 domain 2-type protein [Pyronema omphalodes]|nr:ribosomal protein S5 domain 2-type protein [Pyronema omphalodes]
MVSAPGKVIVYGEHAVVYGKGAIAAAISLRSYLLVTPYPKPSRTLTLRFSDIGLDHSWEIDALPWKAFTAPGKKRYYFDSLERLDPMLMKALKPFIDAIPGKVLQAAATSFLFLFMMIGNQHSPAAIYTMRSTIPIGAGLGSSASIAVCLSAALQLQGGTLAKPFKGMMPHETQLQLKRINNWAFVGEMCIHGNPSGVDNTVATGGKAVFFKRDDYSQPPEVTHLADFPELPLLLINTKQSRSTAEEVAKVRSLLESHDEITNLMLDTIDKITMEAHSIISSPNFSSVPGSPDIVRLGELIRINHGILVSLGVSHPKLERIRELVDFAGIGWTKLTGAGGGGCSITLLKPNLKPEILQGLEQRLNDEGFQKYETTLGGAGVGVLWPATTTDEFGREAEITQEMFLEADGVKGVESLVGVSSGGKRKWRFWREWVPEDDGGR